ncbi:MAG TPA: ABC transporter permease [Candidatus Angelobacter sp.]|jgi:predicted permease
MANFVDFMETKFQLDTILQDFHFALRQLTKSPGFAATAIFILALGIAASISFFAFVDAALIKPLPYQAPARLVDAAGKVDLTPHASISYPDYLDWKKLNTIFSSLEVYTGHRYNMSTPAGIEMVVGETVSDGFFRTLGVIPILGRDFYAGEDSTRADNTAILSYASWQNRFGRTQNVIGERVTLSGVSYVIVGVLPENFQFAPAPRTEFWTTLRQAEGCTLRRNCRNLAAVGRLKEGATMEAAAADLLLIAKELESQYPDSNRGQGASVQPFSDLIVGEIRPILLLLLGGAGLLLLIASLNVSSLLLVRTERRKREIAVRSALGASPARLIRQFITEGLVLVAISSVIGFAAAAWAIQMLVRLVPANVIVGMPYLHETSLNAHVIVFAIFVSMLAAVLFSVVPIVRLRLRRLQENLTDGSRGSVGIVSRRFGSNLVVLELAVAMMLLVGAGLLGKSLYRLFHVDLGFQPGHLATLEIAVPKAMYKTPDELSAILRRIVTATSSAPGVQSTATAMQLPVTFNGNTDNIRVVGRPYNPKQSEVNQRDVSTTYFKTLQAKLLRGRYFNETDDTSRPGVVIINQTLAKKYFSGEDPVGRKIGDADLSPESIKEIVGVVEDIKEGSLESEVWPAVYYPQNQNPDSYFSLIVRTSQSEQSLLPTLSAIVHQIDPNIATREGATMSDRINDSPPAYLHRSSAVLVGIFAAIALLLGVVGLYGVISYSVSQRTREIAVRMALGAQRGTVYQLILREAALLTGVGIITGLLGSMASATLVRTLLFGTQTWDIPTLLFVTTILLVSAFLGSYVPARRAAAVNPIEGLRSE